MQAQGGGRCGRAAGAGVEEVWTSSRRRRAGSVDTDACEGVEKRHTCSHTGRATGLTVNEGNPVANPMSTHDPHAHT
eukprot:364554-Chlamydomonas_euryale.AAC.2